jgi:phage terminase small subunit
MKPSMPLTDEHQLFAADDPVDRFAPDADAAALDARPERVGLTQDWVLGRLREVAERCLQHEAVRDRKGDPTGEYTFNVTGANKALELIGRHLGMFAERQAGQNPNFAVSAEPLSDEEWEKRHGRPA